MSSPRYVLKMSALIKIRDLLQPFPELEKYLRDKFAEVSASSQSNIDFITLAGNLKKKYYDGKKITVNFLKKKSNIYRLCISCFFKAHS